MSAEEGGGEGIKHKRLGFNGNETLRSVHDDDNTIAPHDIVNSDLEDDSVWSGQGWGICEEEEKVYMGRGSGTG
ncbi:hypothetical protein TL16_g09853 [Triparma laevis f. inornata]|uniref:Uncharacterized protein n=1 Tax=Triparma laevis f. inornata TaxID=1714386 RepID=A0A9W7BDM5_9STRA|nr:hypothetical protein TL16_g09853 [Triparma laevis f. inornata]